jgi:hypothetical protein
LESVQIRSLDYAIDTSKQDGNNGLLLSLIEFVIDPGKRFVEILAMGIECDIRMPGRATMSIHKGCIVVVEVHVDSATFTHDSHL